MKKTFLIVALLATVFVQHVAAQDAQAVMPLPQLLSLYLNIKNALVAGEAGTAAAKATEFLTFSKAVDTKTLSEAEHSAFMPLLPKLAADAKSIAESKNLEKQRTSFASLSNNMYALAKAAKLSQMPVYQAYCPMKKVYWLSSEAAKKNPYLGHTMLTCGSIKATL